jgi:hypothetical protein
MPHEQRHRDGNTLLVLIALVSIAIGTWLWVSGDMHNAAHGMASAMTSGGMTSGGYLFLNLIVTVVYGALIVFILWHLGLWPRLAEIFDDVRTILADKARQAADRLEPKAKPQPVKQVEHPVTKAIRELNERLDSIEKQKASEAVVKSTTTKVVKA